MKILQQLIALFIKTQGRKPSGLELIRLKQKAWQQSMDKSKVIQFPQDRITDWTKPRPTTGKKADVVPSEISKKDKTLEFENMPRADKDILFDKFMVGADQVYFKFVNDTLVKIQKAGKADQLLIAKEIINRKGMYRYLDDKDATKILKSIDQNIKPVEPKAYGGIAGMLGERTGYFTGALADTEQGKAMSPGTSADYSPGQGHRETRETRVAPPGAGTQTYTAPPKHFEQTGFLSDVRKKNREKYLNILKKYPTDEFRKWQKLSYLEGDPSLITEEERQILAPYGTSIWSDMAREDPQKFMELYKGKQTGSSGVAPKVGGWDEPDIDRPYEYNWLAGGGIAGMLGERTGYDNGKLVSDPTNKSPENFYNLGFGSLLEDVMRDAPKKGTWTEKDLKYLWDVLQGDQDMGIEDLMLRFGRRNPEKKSEFFTEIGKDKAGFGWKKQFASGGLAGMLGEPTYSDGGRTGFAGGKLAFDAARRKFLQWVGAGAAGVGVAKSGLFSLLKGGGKKQVVESLTQVPIKDISGMPAWFKPLVNKVIKEGDDVTKKFATKDREIVHRAQIDKDASVDVIQDLDTGNVRLEYDAADNLGYGPIQLDYKAGEVIEQGSRKGTKTKAEFSAVESEPRVTNWDGDIEFDGENIVSKVDDLLTDTTKLETYATGKNPTIKKLLKSEQKKKYVNKLNDDVGEQLDYIENKTGHMAPEDLIEEGDAAYHASKEGLASGGRVPLGGGKLVFEGVVKGGNWLIKNLMGVREAIRINKNYSPERIKLWVGQIDDQIKSLKAGEKIPDEVIQKIRSDPKFKSVWQNQKSADPELREMEEVLLEYGQKHAEGGRVPLFGGLLAKGGVQLGKFSKSEVLIKMLEKTLKGSKDPWVKTNLPNFIKELKAKPKLANDPQVWNFFTNKLPKNQKFVVHSDDTVDLWSQSEFGPHNIKTTDKFMQKHPNLSRDEAVRIQNMEPEDQILEMKRLETIADRSRTKNATGGRVSLSAGGLAGMLGE